MKDCMKNSVRNMAFTPCQLPRLISVSRSKTCSGAHDTLLET